MVVYHVDWEGCGYDEVVWHDPRHRERAYDLFPRRVPEPVPEAEGGGGGDDGDGEDLVRRFSDDSDDGHARPLLPRELGVRSDMTLRARARGERS